VCLSAFSHTDSVGFVEQSKKKIKGTISKKEIREMAAALVAPADDVLPSLDDAQPRPARELGRGLQGLPVRRLRELARRPGASVGLRHDSEPRERTENRRGFPHG